MHPIITPKFTFKPQKNGSIYALDVQSTKRLATYKFTDVAWECEPNPKVEMLEGVAEAMDAAFAEFLEKQALADQSDQEPDDDETANDAPSPASVESIAPSVVPPPAPDGVSGTASLEYLQWAAEHATDEQFRELYGQRITEKPTFLPWATQQPELKKFVARAKKLFPR